jgi:glutamine amidotransferase
MGWNTIYDLRGPLFKGLSEEAYCYFVHSYYAAFGEHTIATTNYILSYSAALHRGNFYGVQFHPEKSALAGEQIIRNFLEL